MPWSCPGHAGADALDLRFDAIAGMIAPARRSADHKSALSNLSYAHALVLHFPSCHADPDSTPRAGIVLLILGTDGVHGRNAAERGPDDAGAAVGAIPVEGKWSHAYAAYGQPKYPAGSSTSTTSIRMRPRVERCNCRSRTGAPASTSSIRTRSRATRRRRSVTLMFETLAVRSGDEPDTMYGLLAEDIQVAPDKSWIAFRMQSQGPLHQRRSGDRCRRQVLVRHVDQQGSRRRTCVRSSTAWPR